MAFVKFKGFAPDSESNVEGILLEGSGFMPSIRGVVPIPTGTPAGLATLTGTCKGSASLQKLDGSRRLFAAAQTSDTGGQLYEAATSTWTDVTRAAGSYTTTAQVLWTFAQYNDVALAAQKGAFIQASAGSGAFGDPQESTASSTASDSFAPKAAIVEVVLDFVFAFNTETLAFGNDTNRWQCTAAGDYLDWEPDISTLAASGLLTDSGGPIRAGKKLGSDIVAYKRDSMFLGQFVGPPNIWSFRLIPGTGLGAPGPHAVVDVESMHIFPATDNFYIYDGTRPVPIGTNRVAEFFFTELNEEFRDQTIGFHDRINWRVFWLYPSVNSSTGLLDSMIIYNYRSDKWGFTRIDDWQSATTISTVQFAVPYSAQGITYDQLGSSYATYDDLPAVSYDDAFAVSGTLIPSFFDSQGLLRRMDGGNFDMKLTTGDYGTDDTIQICKRVRPRFVHSPGGLPTGTITASHLVKDNLGESASIRVATVNFSAGSFDAITISRWHSFQQIYPSASHFEIEGIDVTMAVEEQE